MQKKIKIVLIIVLSIMLIIAALLIVEVSYEGDPVERVMLALTRTEAGRTEPDFSKEIHDIRITARERNIGFLPTIFLSEEARQMQYYQLYYGYYSDGEWHDIPAENYDLKALMGKNDYDTIFEEHCVRMGDFVLLVFPVPASPSKKVLGVIEDTLASEVKVIDEYATASVAIFSANGANCGHFIDGHLYGNYVDATDSFDLYYYIALDINTLPENYQVTVMRCYEADENDIGEKDLYEILEGENQGIYTISSEWSFSYDDIMNALNRE